MAFHITQGLFYGQVLSIEIVTIALPLEGCTWNDLLAGDIDEADLPRFRIGAKVQREIAKC